MQQVVQLVGAVLILIAFVGAQRRRMSPQSLPYLVLNLIGSVALFASALAGQDWGFVLLEGVWAAVSVHGLVTREAAPGAAG